MHTIKKFLRFTVLLIFLLNTVSNSIAQNLNEIDSIKTDSDAICFLKKHFEEFKDFNFENIYTDSLSRGIADSLKLDLWKKADFDNNGRTDLFVLNKYRGQRFITVLAFENNEYKTPYLIKENCGFPIIEEFPKITKMNHLDVINLYHFNTCVKSDLTLDTLVYMNSHFFEFNDKENQVRKIKISYGSFWDHYSFITIKKNHKFRRFSYSKTHLFGGHLSLIYKLRFHFRKISTTEFTQLWPVLNNINWNNLKSEYILKCCNDMAGADILVFYNKGEIKKLYDYGLSGTYGMAYLHQWIDDYERKHIIKEKRKRHEKVEE
jgi:hypothetical protein